MTRITWDTPGTRLYETGVDHGVLYPDGQDGVPWNGLISVNETPTGGEVKSYYIDGYNHVNVSARSEYAAAIEAFYSPPEFDQCDGSANLRPGLSVTNQPRQPFGLTYRTLLGNDVNGQDYSYKIHVVYNALVAPADRAYSSVSDDPEAVTLKWDISTKPMLFADKAPSAHLIIDPRSLSTPSLNLLEGTLYGTDTTAPRLPPPDELIMLIDAGNLITTTVRLTAPARTKVSGSWGEAVYTDGARTVAVKRSIWSRIFQQKDMPVSDDFNRTRSGTGWGTATRGGAWQHAGGTNPGNYSTVPGKGQLIIDTTLDSRHAYLGLYDASDQVVASRFGLSRRPTRHLNGGIACGLTIARVDTTNHYRCKMEIKDPNIADDFTRTVANGWGSASSGYTWATSGGTAADYSVDGAVGKMAMSAVGSSRRLQTSSAMDGEILVKISPNQVATGGGATAAAMIRYLDLSNHYLGRLEFTTTGAVNLRIQKILAGATNDLTADYALPGTYIANDAYWVRFQIYGNSLKARAWKDGTAEPNPTTWHLSVVDDDIVTAGGMGVRGFLLTGNTNAGFIFSYDSFAGTRENGKDVIVATIQKQVAGTLTDLISTPYGTMDENAQLELEAKMTGSLIEYRIWKAGEARPASPVLSINDTTFTSGRGGVYANILSNETTMTANFSNFYSFGTVVAPAQFTTDQRVYISNTPHVASVVNPVELLPWVVGGKEDLVDVAMAYIYGAPPVYDEYGRKVRGDSHYGPRTADGSLVEGGDFNDYLGRDWTYPDGTVDPAEPAEIECMDCSGYVRMVFGPMGKGMQVRKAAGNDGVAIPRVSFEQVAVDAPGASIIPNTGATPTDLTPLQIGDVLGFDADSNETTSGQIDHTGIYMGLDSLGAPVFVSSRKTVDGPSFSKTGGSSNLTGGGLYATRFRVARRY